MNYDEYSKFTTPHMPEISTSTGARISDDQQQVKSKGWGHFYIKGENNTFQKANIIQYAIQFFKELLPRKNEFDSTQAFEKLLQSKIESFNGHFGKEVTTIYKLAKQLTKLDEHEIRQIMIRTERNFKLSRVNDSNEAISRFGKIIEDLDDVEFFITKNDTNWQVGFNIEGNNKENIDEKFKTIEKRFSEELGKLDSGTSVKFIGEEDSKNLNKLTVTARSLHTFLLLGCYSDKDQSHFDSIMEETAKNHSPEHIEEKKQTSAQLKSLNKTINSLMHSLNRLGETSRLQLKDMPNYLQAQNNKQLVEEFLPKAKNIQAILEKIPIEKMSIEKLNEIEGEIKKLNEDMGNKRSELQNPKTNNNYSKPPISESQNKQKAESGINEQIDLLSRQIRKRLEILHDKAVEMNSIKVKVQNSPIDQYNTRIEPKANTLLDKLKKIQDMSRQAEKKEALNKLLPEINLFISGRPMPKTTKY